MGALILVIDDDADLRNLTKRIFESGGYRVALAANGARGLELVDELKPQMVLVDIIMPGRAGFDTIREIRKRGLDIRIVAITGGGVFSQAPDLLTLARQLGADAVMPKPFRAVDLLAMARRQLEDQPPPPAAKPK